jgi:hypothetical protein
MANQMVKVDSFPAKNSRGEYVTLVILSERETKPAGYLFPAQVVEVNRHLRTSDGMDVDRQEKGTYLIRDTGEQLSSDDPKAL